MSGALAGVVVAFIRRGEKWRVFVRARIFRNAADLSTKNTKDTKGSGGGWFAPSALVLLFVSFVSFVSFVDSIRQRPGGVRRPPRESPDEPSGKKTLAARVARTLICAP